MPTKWTIDNAKGGGNDSELIGCHLAISGTNYQFQLPSGSVVATTTGTTLPTLPFNFPMFNSALAGTTAVNWYITVESTTDGVSGNKAKGTWSNTGFVTGITDTDPPTWTTQAGVGIDPEGDQGEDEGNDKAAYAAPKL